MPSIIDNKDKFEILKDFVEDYTAPDTSQHQIRKLAIQVRCTEDIEKSIGNLEASINKNAESNDRLARKVFYLNIVLTVATALAAIAALIGLL